jgi:hypothetical protein
VYQRRKKVHGNLLLIFYLYMLLKGAAAVANIAAPRSAVATPIIRSTTSLQSSAGMQHAAKYVICNV